MADLLRMDYINSLPQPFLVRLVGRKTFDWPLESIDVQTGLIRIDVCGLLEVKTIGDVGEFKDAHGVIHDPDTFWTDYEDQP